MTTKRATTVAELRQQRDRLQRVADAVRAMPPSDNGDRWLYLTPGHPGTEVRVSDLRSVLAAYVWLRNEARRRTGKEAAEEDEKPQTRIHSADFLHITRALGPSVDPTILQASLQEVGIIVSDDATPREQTSC